MFYDRTEAGLALAKQLEQFRGKSCVVLGIPRGGVPVAAVVAKELGAPLDLLLCKKIGHPFQKEYAIGAVSLTDVFLVAHPDVSKEYTDAETIQVRNRLRQMQETFLGNRPPVPLKNKIAIVVDDGIATGNTLLAAVHVLRKSQPSQIIIAVPVASRSALDLLTPEVDQIICLLKPDFFTGVGAFYEDFQQVSDEEVAGLLKTQQF